MKTATQDAEDKEKEAKEQDPPEEFDVAKAIEDARAEEMEKKEDFIDGHADKPDLEEMMTVEKDKLTELRENFENALEGLIEAFEAKGVQVYGYPVGKEATIVKKIDTDISAEFVFTKL